MDQNGRCLALALSALADMPYCRGYATYLYSLVQKFKPQFSPDPTAQGCDVQCGSSSVQNPEGWACNAPICELLTMDRRAVCLLAAPAGCSLAAELMVRVDGARGPYLSDPGNSLVTKTACVSRGNVAPPEDRVIMKFAHRDI